MEERMLALSTKNRALSIITTIKTTDKRYLVLYRIKDMVQIGKMEIWGNLALTLPCQEKNGLLN